jgi:hypothetical protein
MHHLKISYGSIDYQMKKKHLAFMLLLAMLVIDSVAAVFLLFTSIAASLFPESWMAYAFGLVSLTEVVSVVLVLRWKNMGVFGLVGTTVARILLSLVAGWLAIAFASWLVFMAVFELLKPDLEMFD